MTYTPEDKKLAYALHCWLHACIEKETPMQEVLIAHGYSTAFVELMHLTERWENDIFDWILAAFGIKAENWNSTEWVLEDVKYPDPYGNDTWKQYFNDLHTLIEKRYREGGGT